MRRSIKLASAAVVGAGAFLALRSRSEQPDASVGVAEWAPLVPAPTAPTTPAARDTPSTATDAVDGHCPAESPIKGKAASMIYHQPGGRNYERTNADYCFATVEDAEEAGFRPPKS